MEAAVFTGYCVGDVGGKRRDSPASLRLRDPRGRRRADAEGIFDPNVVMNPTEEGPSYGVDAIRDNIEHWQGAWEDLEVTAEELIDAGDRVLVTAHHLGRGRGSGSRSIVASIRSTPCTAARFSALTSTQIEPRPSKPPGCRSSRCPWRQLLGAAAWRERGCSTVARRVPRTSPSSGCSPTRVSREAASRQRTGRAAAYGVPRQRCCRGQGLIRRAGYRASTTNPSSPSTLTAPLFPPSKSPEASRLPVANS